jgi:hypothetical protein
MSKQLLLLTLFFTLTACSFFIKSDPPCARIGASQSEMKKVTRKYFATHPVGSEYEIIENKDPKLHISAGFEKGLCNRIKYISVNQQRISDHTVSVILSLNSRGVAWIVQETPVNAGKVYYRSADGKYRAVLTDGKELFVFSEALFQNSMAETNAKKLKEIQTFSTTTTTPHQ